MSWYKSILEQRLKAIEIQFFDDDPEGDPDRAGDGYYFREPGKGWSGAWYSPDECVAIAREDLMGEYREIDWKVANFNHCRTQLFRFVAEGTAKNPRLSYDPYAILWTPLHGEGTKPFKLLLLARSFSEAKSAVSRRMHKDANFSVRRIKGRLKSVCRRLGGPHPQKPTTI